MDIKTEIGRLRNILSESSRSLFGIIRPMRPQNELKQELGNIQTTINEAVSKLEEIENSL